MVCMQIAGYRPTGYQRRWRSGPSLPPTASRHLGHTDPTYTTPTYRTLIGRRGGCFSVLGSHARRAAVPGWLNLRSPPIRGSPRAPFGRHAAAAQTTSGESFRASPAL
jgi:hypothetical protein